MSRCDMHVHSSHSAHPSEWFLQRIGTRESYTSPEQVYESAKAQGMDFVTLTDHNCIDGALWLREHHPDDTFTGVEVTAYFPEDGAKIHVLVYGLDEAQFEVIDRIRTDIYQLSDYVHAEQLAHSVAHATFSVNGRLSQWHVERLLLLFECFEGINGARPSAGNETVCSVIAALTDTHILELTGQHSIAPASPSPWLKGLSGGSDDHSNLFVGQTFTTIDDARSPDEFLERFRNRESSPGGRHNDFQSFAFSIYKIAYEFSKSQTSPVSGGLLSTVNRMLFDGETLGFRHRVALRRMKWRRPKSNSGGDLLNQFSLLVEQLREQPDLTSERKVDLVYERIADISDQLCATIFTAMGAALKRGDLGALVRHVSSLIPTLFLSLPFLTTLNVLYGSRTLLGTLRKRFDCEPNRNTRRILWFSDTLTDLNGPSETIRHLAWLSRNRGLRLIPVASLLEGEFTDAIPPQTLSLPPVWTFTPSFFQNYTLRVPSLLRALKTITESNPDEILISTPGPVGLLGVLASRALHVPCRSIYHTDFASQASFILGDEQMSRGIDDYIRWFYSLSDSVMVPTREYIRILGRRGYDTSRMSLFRRGIETELFTPDSDARAWLRDTHGVREGFTLLYAGRVSRDKDLELLAQAYERVRRSHPEVNLVVCGDGPYLADMQARLRGQDRTHFVGRVARTELPRFYAAADLLVFPSTTDTFGMVVLEAQACGLAAMVSTVGGPREVVRDGKSGFVVEAGSVDAWASALERVYSGWRDDREGYEHYGQFAREYVTITYNWNAMLNDLFGIEHIDDIAPQSAGEKPPAEKTVA